MENEAQKNQNENITPFWEYYMPHAREVIERRNEDKNNATRKYYLRRFTIQLAT